MPFQVLSEQPEKRFRRRMTLEEAQPILEDITEKLNGLVRLRLGARFRRTPRVNRSKRVRRNESYELKIKRSFDGTDGKDAQMINMSTI